jgi:hypothetical protein
MKRASLLILVLISTALITHSKPLTTLPFRVEKNCIYVYCKVNDTDSLKFLFDTGADGSVINKQALSKLALNIDGRSTNQGSNGSNEVEKSSENEITLGSISKKGVGFMIIPFETNAFDGIIGTDLMKDHLIEIDYDKQLMLLYEKGDNSIDYKTYEKFKMHTDHYPTYVKGSVIINGKKHKGFFGLDTGADDALTLASPFAKRNNIGNKAPIIAEATAQGSDGSEYKMSIVLLQEIIFAGKRLYRVPAALSNATEGIDATNKLVGFYGNAFLRKFNVILDYNNQRIYFRLNDNLYKKYSE